MRRLIAAAGALLALAGCSLHSSSQSTLTATVPSSSGSTAAHSNNAPVCPQANAPSVGRCVLITNRGFQPHFLLAPAADIAFKNVSDHTQSVHFDNYERPVDSGPIKPGGEWIFHNRYPISIVYHSTYNPAFKGTLEIGM
jgi:hypothetical protein